ncbi:MULTISPECIES: hypothetical protein [Bradyrhizobium]|nr:MULTISPECIES: hypothetical protein [Bradyrhizobium]MBP1296275.1 vacuolar-type H+-ATPase subunit I/STV1 [Bradyrhizobium elkanii]MBP2434712.1 vacuolar-type H+-ATPase subunit I/STV1 [Bradyrhizobium elkanii]MCP1732049.1 vacuolar-type H+-ATPase subunit I/STV1 [Bradyrhizobium elkanii]MCP1749718.1 vacuolar-type H+-ATPase subunit I/STV1 [Bradyrhizobium elkanii]MCP1932824.1 vacuolar-type H+-ATPase subunit I/STV1 [Bradyrhizobium elkanii]
MAKYVYASATNWVAPLALIKSVHLLERIGLATVGASCGMYVGAALMHLKGELFGSDWFIWLVMLFGAFSFYIGIDLPGRPAQRSTSRLPGERTTGTDAAEILSAAGTFVAAITAFLCVNMIVLDHVVSDGSIVLIACCWAIGCSLQIAAGTVSRNYDLEMMAS